MAIDFPQDSNERELRLLIARAQYERGAAGKVSALVEREMSRVLDVMLSAKYRDLSAFERQRLNQLYKELDRIIQSGYATVSDTLTTEMRQYAQVEADVSRATVNAVLSSGAPAGELAVSFYRLPQTYLKAIATLPIQGLRIGEWYEGQAASLSLQTRRVIQQGLVEGKGIAEISRRILAPERAKVAAGEAPPLSKRAKNEARIVARTTVSAVQADATKASNAALPRSISDSYMLVAVLDKRTSAICRAKDGLVFKYDDPDAEHPPFHMGGCRTTERALLKGADLTIATQKIPPTMRGYSEWLRRQPNSVQNDILGPTRAQWFRDNRMTLAEAIDQDNRILTLPQLRATLGLTDVAREVATV